MFNNNQIFYTIVFFLFNHSLLLLLRSIGQYVVKWWRHDFWWTNCPLLISCSFINQYLVIPSCVHLVRSVLSFCAVLVKLVGLSSYLVDMTWVWFVCNSFNLFFSLVSKWNPLKKNSTVISHAFQHGPSWYDKLADSWHITELELVCLARTSLLGFHKRSIT